MRNICIIADGYPSKERSSNVFVKELVTGFVSLGIDCTVIAPQSFTKAIKHKYKLSKRKRLEDGVEVYSPFYVTLPCNFLGRINFSRLNCFSFKHSVKRVFRKLEKEKRFDAIYSHFLFPAGVVSSYLSKKYDIPAFVAYGESSDFSIKYLGDAETRARLKNIKGVISVSTKNRQLLIDHDIFKPELISVFLNGVNHDLFKKDDANRLRHILKLDEDDFVVIFVGRFIKSKGVNEVEKALNEINKDRILVKSIFIGSGRIKPKCTGMVFCGSVEHSKLPDYLNASNVFVLPTRAEGCCNSIIEAMACGLPTISSDLPFNYDILNKSNSILIDPNDIDGLKTAILWLMKNKNEYANMAKAALASSRHLDIKERATNILHFMEEKSRK